MANDGHFTDRYPIICAAGIRNKALENIADIFKEYPLEDVNQAKKAQATLSVEKDKLRKESKIDPVGRHPGIYTGSRNLLRPRETTRYQQLITDLKETSYTGYWNKILGATPDSIPSFPEGKDPKEMTFGTASRSDGSVKELIQPSKTPYEVLWDSQINHDVYKKIYNDYNPGEQIDRGYSPPFDRKLAFGKYTGYDKRGLKAKCCAEWSTLQHPLEVVEESQSNWAERNRRKLGKCYEPNRILQKLPKGHIFGAQLRKDKYTMEDLLRPFDSPVPDILKNFRTWLVSLHRLKQVIDNRLSPGVFDYYTLLENMISYDTNNVGLISYMDFLEVMHNNELIFHYPNVKSLMQYLKIMEGDQIKYQLFLDVLTGIFPFDKFHDLSPDDLYFTSVYQEDSCDIFKPDPNLYKRVAGLPSEKVKDWSDTKSCLSPSIFAQYSLSYQDFAQPRCKEFIKLLFHNVGYSYSDEEFEKLWKIAIEKEQSDKVSVQTFRDLLREYYRFGTTIQVDELSYCEK